MANRERWIMNKLLLLLVMIPLLGASCDSDTVRVRYVPTSADKLSGVCESLYGHSSGCTVHEKDGSVTIYAPAPKNVEDEDAMIPIGHEFLCHAWLNQSHRNVDPSNDCIAGKK